MKTNIFKFAVGAALTLILMQAALYLFMWTSLLHDPSLKGMDFISFYTAGRIAREGHYPQLFDLEMQRAVQARIVGAGAFEGSVNLSQHLLPTLHPPYIAPLLSLLAVDDFVQSYILWSVVRLGFMLLCMILIQDWLQTSGWDAISAWVVTLGAACFFPFFLGLLGGQDTVFIILGLLLWLFGLDQKHEALAGFGLAFSSLSPLVVGALGIPLLATRRKSAAWFVAFMVLLGAYSMLLVGLQGAKDFLALMGLSSQGGGYGLNQMVMYNLLGLLLRSLPNADPTLLRMVAWTAFAAAIVFSVWLWWDRRKTLSLERIGLALVLVVFTLPHLHTHALSYLLLPLLIVTTGLYTSEQKTLAILLIPSSSMLLLLVTFLSAGVTYFAYYLFMAGLSIRLGWMVLLHPATDAIL